MFTKIPLKKVNFANYELFNDVNEAHSNFFKKVRAVIDNIEPCNTRRVKANTQKGFDGEVLENVNIRDKLFKRFQKSRLHTDKGLYKKVKYNTLKLITAKERQFFDDKLSEYIENPKEIWQTLKSFDMPKKILISNFSAVESNNKLTFDKKTIPKIFQDFFLNLAESLSINSLILQINTCHLESVLQYYSK